MFVSPAQTRSRGRAGSKSPETPSPVQSHSARTGKPSHRNADQDDCYVSPRKQHQSRKTNFLPNFQRQKKQKIKYPKSNDPQWKILDQELNAALPQIFSRKIINKLSSQQLMEKLDSWLHAFFLEKCGLEESVARGAKPYRERPNKAMQEMREHKNQAGLEGTEEWNIITKQWLSLVRRHNRLRRALKGAKNARQARANERRFKADPYRYAKELLKPVGASGKPTFTKEKAEEYFSNLYHDPGRGHNYAPLPESRRPDLPSAMFDTNPPSLRDVFRSVRRKRNAAAPGMNGISYLPFKKCPSIVLCLHRILLKIWKTRDIPADWAVAYIALLSKSDVLDNPAEFRPIAVTNTSGKIFFSIISDRLQDFLVKNGYIKREVQKGFLAGVAGCVEHGFALWEAMRDAKEHKKAFVTTWIDLANAYGSVRHNLIQFALEWYHVPKFIQELIFRYYEQLCATIVTSGWTTGFFLFDIGCFQGCVLSTILFDCVFNMLLDFLEPMSHLGYKFKRVAVVNYSKAYADDLAVTTRTANGNQKVLDRSVAWLEWTVTMKAKPRKCVALGFRQFKPGATSKQGFVPHTKTVYSPYDPRLKIAGKPVGFIVNTKEKDPFKASHFKFLGRWIYISPGGT